MVFSVCNGEAVMLLHFRVVVQFVVFPACTDSDKQFNISQPQQQHLLVINIQCMLDQLS